MLKVDQQWIDEVDAQRPGFRKTVEHWDAAELPPCPSCGSDDTAQVSAGLVGKSIHLAAATTKILPNGHPADFYCNQCESYFNEGGATCTHPKHAPGGRTIPGKDVLEITKTPEGSRALYEQTCEAMGITPVPESDETGEGNDSPGSF
jgi:hypothetical protein